MKTTIVALSFFRCLARRLLKRRIAFPPFICASIVLTLGINPASALRERIRGWNGYTLGSGPTKDHSGFDIILTCVAIPGHERTASAVSMSSTFSCLMELGIL